MRMCSMASFYTFKSTVNNTKIHLSLSRFLLFCYCCSDFDKFSLFVRHPLTLTHSLTQSIELNNVALKSYAFYCIQHYAVQWFMCFVLVFSLPLCLSLSFSLHFFRYSSNMAVLIGVRTFGWNIWHLNCCHHVAHSFMIMSYITIITIIKHFFFDRSTPIALLEIIKSLWHRLDKG